MTGPPIIIAGHITEISPPYILLGTTRIDLPDSKLAEGFKVGDSVTVSMIAVSDKKYVAENLVRSTDQGPIGGDLSHQA
jgi:hypothetical protein